MWGLARLGLLFVRSCPIQSNGLTGEVKAPLLISNRRAWNAGSARVLGGWENLGSLACHRSITGSLPGEPNE